MKQKLQLQIPEPCHQNWHTMTATQQGRFCLSCQKEVVDFSVMTDTEILHYISGASEKICGRFGNEQLNRNLTAPAAPRKIWWKYWMSVAASFILLSSKSNGQQKFSKDSIVYTAPKNVNNATPVLMGKVGGLSIIDDNKKDYLLDGIVKDEQDNPVIGATVMIKDTKRGVVTDEKGRFTIRVTGSNNTLLTVSTIGYDTQEIKIVHANADPVVRVNVRMRATVMGFVGEVMVVKKKKKTFLDILKFNKPLPVKPQPQTVLKVYPNPVSIGSDVTIKMDGVVNGGYLVSVYDMQGNIIVNKEIIVAVQKLEASITCDHRFTSGMYVMKLTGNGKAVTSKFIVQ